MDIYESGRDDLETQIMHWQLLRQEQILFHYARKNGVMRLGYQPVPPLATSEAKAKDAIGMVILLESLQQSAYGKESWTLTQTSLETVRSPPANCFKKGPQNIEVMFDNDPENLMVYTAWSFIYYQTVDDTWNKVEGHVDYYGAYYFEGDLKVYYIQFEGDAARFSKTGRWEVHVNKDTIFAPVTSSSPAAGEGTDASPINAASRSSPARGLSATSVSTRTTQRTSPRRYRRKASSPTATTTRHKRQDTRRSRSTSRGKQATSRGGDRRRRRRERSYSRDTSSSPDRGRGGRSRGGPETRSQSRSLSRSRSRSRSRGSSSRGGVAPDAVGKSVRTVGRDHSGRLKRLLDEARDPPVIVLRGDANKLKCYRYRAKKKHGNLVKYYSTTWSWVGGSTNDRIGRSRMLLAFQSNTERELFLKTMKLPPGVDWSLGHLDEL